MSSIEDDIPNDWHKMLEKIDIVKIRKKEQYSRSVFHDLPENFLLEAINAAEEAKETVKLKFRKTEKINY